MEITWRGKDWELPEQIEGYRLQEDGRYTMNVFGRELELSPEKVLETVVFAQGTDSEKVAFRAMRNGTTFSLKSREDQARAAMSDHAHAKGLEYNRKTVFEERAGAKKDWPK